MITNFRGLLDDKIRIEAFRRAISEVINENTTVLEIGSALGTYSFFAAQSNAKSIYAIEMNDVFYVGEEIARRNGFLNRIKFIKGKSTEIELPEKVDFIIMEDYSPIFLYENLENIIIDARKRFLKENGKFIPNKIILNAALVEAPTLHQSIDLWQNQRDVLFDINWDYTTELAFNRPYYAEYHKLTPLTDSATIKTIDLVKDSNFPFSFSRKTVMIEDGIVHGIAGWWDTYFTANQFFSNSPKEQNNTWGQMFFPFQYPINVKKGDSVKFKLQVLESNNSKNIDFKWAVEHENSQQNHNSFKGSVLPFNNLLKK